MLSGGSSVTWIQIRLEFLARVMSWITVLTRLIIHRHPEPGHLSALQQGLGEAQPGDPGIRHNKHRLATQPSEKEKCAVNM